MTPTPGTPATLSAYDALGRLIQSTATDGATRQTRYSLALDAAGLRRVQALDENGAATTSLLDAWGRVLQVSPPTANGQSIHPTLFYSYDTLGQLAQVTRGGATTTLQYDLGGRKSQLLDPDLGSWSYSYDALGNLLQQSDARGCLTSLSYDLLNRPLSKSFSGACSGTSVQYSYDQGTNGIGHRSAMSDASGSSSWGYDARGRMVSETRQVSGYGSFATAWGYNSADALQWMQYPSSNNGQLGETVTYAYNQRLLLESVIGNYSYVAGSSYDAAGRLTQRIFGTNQAQSQYSYYPWTAQGGRLQQLVSGTLGNPSSLQDLRYTYGATGNVLTIQDFKMGLPQTQTFSYDPLDRLLSASASGGFNGVGDYSQGYSYDPLSGNLAAKGGVSYSYGDSSHAHAVTSLSNGGSFQYDANGNMTQRTVNGQTYNLSYDAENRLTGVSGASTASFTYNGDGERVVSTVGGAVVVYVGEYFEWQPATTALTKYYYAGSQRVAMRMGSAPPLWLLGDHLGSTAVVANTNGTQHSRKGYKAFGESRFAAGSLPTRYQFTGQASHESDFGLYFYKARWYDPYLSRFSQPDQIIPDPYNPQDWNRYQYTRANPLKYTDPTGHFPWLLIPILIFIATIPGDTGSYEVDPATAAFGEAALRFVDPVDWVYTGIDCLSGNCSGTDLLFGLLPFVNGGLDDAADAAKALNSTDALAHADDLVETAGQLHHIFSNKISNALNEHRTLSGVLNRDDFKVQGLDAASHNGYQAWHRAYDQEVVNWLYDNPRATPEQFLSYMRDLYQRTEMDKRFPQAWQQLQMAIEEWE